jgi:hypothetical protein
MRSKQTTPQLSSSAKAGDPVRGDLESDHNRRGVLDNTPLSRSMTACVVATLAILCSSLASRVLAGTWKHEYVTNDGNVLTYSDDGKIIFYMSCGRGFAIAMKYPGKARKQGDAEIAIATSKGSQILKGQFEEPIEVQDPVPRKFATSFRQVNLNYPHAEDRIFGKEWNAKKARLLDLLDAHSSITISAGKASYQLPAIDVAADWHKLIEVCKFD